MGFTKCIRGKSSLAWWHCEGFDQVQGCQMPVKTSQNIADLQSSTDIGKISQFFLFNQCDRFPLMHNWTYRPLDSSASTGQLDTPQGSYAHVINVRNTQKIAPCLPAQNSSQRCHSSQSFTRRVKRIGSHSIFIHLPQNHMDLSCQLKWNSSTVSVNIPRWYLRRKMWGILWGLAVTFSFYLQCLTPA